MKDLILLTMPNITTLSQAIAQVVECNNGFFSMAKRNIWSCPPYIKTLHPPCLLTISNFTKGKPHAN